MHPPVNVRLMRPPPSNLARNSALAVSCAVLGRTVAKLSLCAEGDTICLTRPYQSVTSCFRLGCVIIPTCWLWHEARHLSQRPVSSPGVPHPGHSGPSPASGAWSLRHLPPS